MICFLLCVIFKCSVPIGVFPQWDLDCCSMTGIKYLPKGTWRMKKFIWLSGYSPAPRKQGRSLDRDHSDDVVRTLTLTVGPTCHHSLSLSFSFLSHPSSHSKLSVLSFSTGWRNTCSVLLESQCLGSWHRIKKNPFTFNAIDLEKKY